MFLTRRPSDSDIKVFIEASAALSLSYHQIGTAQRDDSDFTHDDAASVIGHGPEAFAKAKRALEEWRQFDLGWVELFPHDAPTGIGTNVAVLIRHPGLWSLNGCRVVYQVGEREAGPLFGVAYGTLTNHAECGEELFEVLLDPKTLEVTYRIRAASRPRALLARAGYPYTRWCQSRFRRDSLLAMRAAVESF